MKPPADPLPPDVREAMQRGDALEAIRLLRKRTGLGLKEAKHVVDRGAPADAAFFPAHDSPPPPPLAPPLHDPAAIASLRSPGEVPRSAGVVWWLVAAAAVALLLWFVLAG